MMTEKEMTAEETKQTFLEKLSENSKGAYVSCELFQLLQKDNNFENDTYISNEIMGYYKKGNKKIPVICDFTTIGRNKSDRYFLDDLGEKAFIIK